MGTRTQPEGRSTRHGRDTLEFARVVNLSDAVFAIAMTLLVLTLDVPEVPAADLASALAGDLPQFVAFLLSFALVANIWWQHHKLYARLAWIDPGIIAINMGGLGAVALVPFPTGLVGNAPTVRAAVLPFITVFIILNLLYLWLMARAQRVGAWSDPMPPGLFPWLAGGLSVVILAMMVALLVAVWSPLGGLVLLAISSLPERVLARRAPPDYGTWY
jgi:uncharacterized membrane protein